jgi:hypothetical protein
MLGAQHIFRTTPSVALAVVSDSNLLARPGGTHADVISRVTPAIEGDYRSKLVTAAGRFTFDAERFAANPSLTTAHARQHAAFDVRYRLRPRLTIGGDASYLMTNMPSELNVASGLALAHGRARRLGFSAVAIQELSARTEGTLQYTLTQDRLEHGVPTTSSSAAASLAHRVSRRHTGRLEYTLRQFVFGADDLRRSHTVSVGWTADLTRRFRISAAGGPRAGDGALAPELATSLTYHDAKTDVVLAYARTETTLIGLPGTADTDTFSIAAGYGRGHGLRFRVAPAVMKTSRGDLEALVYRLAVGASHPIGRFMLADLSVEAMRQRGDVYIRGANRIARHVVVLSLQVVPPARSSR